MTNATPADGSSICHRGQRGAALVLVLVAVSISLILGMTFLDVSSTSRATTYVVANSTQAHAVAESGLEMALAIIDTDPNWRTDLSEGVWLEDVPFGAGSFTVSLFDGYDTNGNGQIEGDGSLASDSMSPVTVVATGLYQGMSRTLRAVVIPLASEGSRHGHIASHSHIDMAGNPRIDAIDSRQTSYSMWANGWEMATVMTNAASAGSVTLKNSSTIHGHMNVGAGGGSHTVATTGVASVVGDITSAGTSFDLPVITAPANLPPSQGASAFPNWGAGTLNAGTYHYTSFNVTNNYTLYITGDVTIYVTGLFNMHNSGSIILNDGARLTVYADRFVFRGNADLNMVSSTAGNPAHVTLYQTGAQAFTLENSAAVVGQVVAPSARLSMVGNARLFGSAVADEIYLRNSARLTQDMALSDGADSDDDDNDGAQSASGQFHVQWLGERYE